MTLVAALAVGLFCALLAGPLTGQPLQFRSWRRTRRSARAAEVWLAQAGLGVTRRQFVVGSVSAGLVAFAAGFFVTGTALVAIVPAVAAASVPRAYFGRRRAAKMR